MELPDHFFRHETGRITATLSRVFGIQNIDLIEDATQDACSRAVEVWSVRGLPENPSGWLITAAKNRALDILRRERRLQSLSTDLGVSLNTEGLGLAQEDQLANLNAIADDQLRLMFSCGHPNLSEEAQVAIMLHYLCGFSIKEVAQAYLSALPAVDKRITRGKKTLAASGSLFDVTQKRDFLERLPVIHRALYLLFNQGYHGASQDSPVQPLLCREAIRLVTMLFENPFGQTTETFALAALMHLHVARLPGKLNLSGELTQLLDQDRSLWDQRHIQSGFALLRRASSGQSLSEYHIEALMAGVHASAKDFESTDWHKLVHLYNALQQLNDSPVVALNRAIAIAQSEGPGRGLEEIGRISDPKRLESYPFYWATLGELQSQLNRVLEAKESLARAFAIARNPAEQSHLQRKIDSLGV